MATTNITLDAQLSEEQLLALIGVTVDEDSEENACMGLRALFGEECQVTITVRDTGLAEHVARAISNVRRGYPRPRP